MIRKMGISVWLFPLVVISVKAVSTPPDIVLMPDKNIYYKAFETVQIPCLASGDPQPLYKWTRNGREFNPSGNDARFVQLPNSGTLVANQPEAKDEGMFQCFAQNSFGTAATVVVNFREAKLADFSVAPVKYHEAKLGKPLTLPCTPPESLPPAQVVWIIINELTGFDVVNFNDRVTMDREYRLRITNVKAEDSMDGQPYACMAINGFMRSNSQSPWQIIQIEGDTESMQPVTYMWADQDDRFGLRGQPFSMKCIFGGNPTPDVHWVRQGNNSLPAGAKMKSFAQELHFDSLQFEDAGKYDCWATNADSGKRLTRSFNIRVNSAPFFLNRPESQEVGVGSSAEFNCVANGVPSPAIMWFINGVKLRDAKDAILSTSRFKRPTATKIFFSNLELNDHMVLQCNASNIHGYVFANAYLNVLSEPPTILQGPQAKLVTAEGLSIYLTCRTTGKPDPIVTWFKNEVQITGGRYQIMVNGDLHIRGVVLADAGLYECEAKNIYDAQRASGILVVRRKTLIVQKPGDLERNAGMDAKFTCAGTTDPEEINSLRILWLKDGKEITGNDQRMTTNYQDNSLTISGTITRDSGTYTCVATNGLDSAKASAMLTVRDRPDRPTHVVLKDCFKTVWVEWMPGSYNNAPIQYYVVEYSTSFTPNQWDFAQRVNSTQSKALIKLSPFANYTFHVIAFNKIGKSDPSEASKDPCETQPSLPDYHPQNLRTIGFQPNTLYIEWTPVPQIDQNGLGFQYFLEILEKGKDASQTKTFTITDWKTRFKEYKTGLVYSPFEITISARNTLGAASQDPPSITGYSFESLPQIVPSNFAVEKVGDTYVMFSWDFTKSEIGKLGTRIRGEFQGFRIQFWRQNKLVQTIREYTVPPEIAKNTSGNTFTAHVEDMLPNTNMEARIAVANNFFVGSPSEIIRFKTEPGLPGPVDFFRAINIGDTHVNLEWKPPIEDRGDLIGYDMSYQKVNGLDLGEMQEREPQINDPYTSSAYLSGLQPKTKYRIYLYARTEKGRGEGYFIEIVTKKATTPLIPRFTIRNKGEHYINVTWWVNAFRSSGTIVYVEYRKLHGAEWLRTTDEVVNTWKNISDLEAGTTYEVRIKATNGVKSIPSGIDEVRTDGIAVASALVGNIGWFLGMLFATLLLIGLIVLFVICYKRGFRFDRYQPSYNSNSGQAYLGTYDNTARVASGPSQYGPEPAGFNNDYYDDRDYHNYEHDYDDGGFKDKRPPSYSDEVKYQPPAAGDYEDYERRPSYDYDHDDRNYSKEPQKFDKHGEPFNNKGYDDYPDNRYYPKDGKYDYDDDRYNRDDDRYDPRDHDYDHDRRNDGYQRGYDYDSDITPSAPSMDESAAGKPSSTFV